MKKKILQVSCNGLTNGGVQNVIMSIVRNLSDEYQFDILVFNQEGEYYDEEFASYGGKIFRMLPPKNKYLKRLNFYIGFFPLLVKTYHILKNDGPYQAIHCHKYFESAACVVAAKMANVDIRIVHAHNDLSAVKYKKTRILVQKFYKKILNIFATKRIGCSQVANDYLYGKDKESLVVNNAINLEKFCFSKYKRNETNSNELRLLHVGNFSSQKNQIKLVEIAKILKERNVDFSLKMIGGNHADYYHKVCELIRKYELSNQIEVLPPDSNIPQNMVDADLFLFPSEYEGLGIVLIEAQAMRLHAFVSQAIPKEADLGNITFIENDEVENWVQKIIDFDEKEKRKVNLESYDISNVIQKYRLFYSERI